MKPLVTETIVNGEAIRKTKIVMSGPKATSFGRSIEIVIGWRVEDMPHDYTKEELEQGYKPYWIESITGKSTGCFPSCVFSAFRNDDDLLKDLSEYCLDAVTQCEMRLQGKGRNTNELLPKLYSVK